MDSFKSSDAVGKSIIHGYAYYMFINQTLDVFNTSLVVVVISEDRNSYWYILTLLMIFVCSKVISGSARCDGNDLSSHKLVYVINHKIVTNFSCT